MKLSKLISFLEDKFPAFLSEEWDNVGLLVGKRDLKINGILLSLDITEKVIDKAIECGANLIITHHPMIFKPMKNITTDSLTGKKIIRLIENGISVYSMHTNLDSGKNGLNDFLGENILGFKNGKILDSIEKNGREFGIGRVYKLENILTIENLSQLLKEKLKLNSINIVKSNEEKEIKKVALISGAGASYWRKAKKLGAQVLITGDVKYHEAMDAKEENFSLIDIGHFESEWIFSNLLEDLIKKEFEIDIKIFNDGPVFEKM
ncbi:MULTISPECIES: Nif3-like dinuclear metal center hexameric protein [Cetobacterium]|jgi:dinuclear metal center YbgI/SA1388 family protein|uniref:Nif3-like dinuclear metal center hexameric protein n=1 Tax=Candidatus Cetobacterium colombiensis TaxID=3073100 RepID=A0ABU4W7P3_9FUSO|nr:Nif3-like dinuclear metal center hexameric protein [Candidatus Cetobacterium colombiensis]MDX8335269.1 Nif3-like dinuclear metal center hexameric protein [Candidatus Cetobacterium colombiensis]